MLKYLPLLFTTLLSLSLSAADPQWVTSGFSSSVIDGYWIAHPDNFNQKTSWPVILWMHGMGASKDQIKADGPMGQSYARNRFVIVNIHSKNGNSKYNDFPAINAILDTVMQYHKGDNNRLYVCGFSMGGGGTLLFSANSHKRIAAIAPTASAFWTIADITPFVNLPVWTGHCIGDGVINVRDTDSLVARIDRAGEIKFLTLQSGTPPDSSYLSKTHMYTRFQDTKHGAIISEMFSKTQLYNWLLQYTLDSRTGNNQRITLYSSKVHPLSSNNHLILTDLAGRSLEAASMKTVSSGTKLAIISHAGNRPQNQLKIMR